MERIEEYRMARRLQMAEGSGVWVRSRPKLVWMDGVKVALGSRGMTAEAVQQLGRSGESWCISR